jgi:peptidoglycan hydrolase CwlO-like protein
MDKTCLYAIISISVIFGSIIIICFAMFFNYNAKLNKNGVEITKIAYQTKELEKKNGKELKKIEGLEKARKEDREIIDDLQKEFKELKRRS